MSVRHFLPRYSFAGVLFALGMVAPAAAPVITTAPPAFQLTGRVTDARGAPPPHVVLGARDIQSRITIAGTTDSAGRYRLEGPARRLTYI